VVIKEENDMDESEEKKDGVFLYAPWNNNGNKDMENVNN
jgi:hypothetical protein